MRSPDLGHQDEVEPSSTRYELPPDQRAGTDLGEGHGNTTVGNVLINVIVDNPYVS
jgi:hypothetical protein